ncbi:hypothetical protein ACI77J_14735 [Pseudomonas sp. O64]|uniref:Uncharacterized protein n=1 Tax=Pseudomonas antarctica TaxID=219572 RepID=A0A1H0BEV7_9PSED|nr:hypothetical protein [Pseudomonas antarctica]KAF2406431.1 hypothetical protein PSAN_46060 [Pseudomonas antarctica]SDN44140.1 hypothetical protein SAMN04490179_4264 [Pseudomonas antarctica]
MADSRLAVPKPALYRYAVYCCSSKIDLGSAPDHALALFFDQAMAVRYGGQMWPSTFEVIDLLNPEEGAF